MPSILPASIPWSLSSDPTETPFPDAEWLGFDIETTGVNFLDDKLALFSFSDGETALLIDPRQWEEEVLADWIQRNLYTRKLSIHFAGFDLTWMMSIAGQAMVEVWDTMVCEQMLQAGKGSTGFGLKGLVWQYFNTDLSKELQTSFDVEEFTDEQLTYAALDSYYTHRIMQEQMKLVEAEDLQIPGYIERNVTCVFTGMMAEGYRIDEEKHREVISSYEADMLKAAKPLVEKLMIPWVKLEQPRINAMQNAYDNWEDAHAETLTKATRHWYQLMEEHFSEVELLTTPVVDDFKAWFIENKFNDLKPDKKYGEPMGMRRYRSLREKEWKKDHPKPDKPPATIEVINLNSRDQMLPVLEAIGIKLKAYSGEEIAEAKLKAKGDKLAILANLNDYKKAQRAVSGYGTKFLAKRWSDGLLHPDQKQYGAASGRPAGAGPNLLNIKQGPLRWVIVPTRDDYVMIVCDYSQMELRLLAEMSGDPGMIQAFVNGEDIHTNTACEIFGVETPTSDQRKASKTSNFLISYGGGAATLKANLMEDGLDLPWPMCKQVIEGWKQTRQVAWDSLEAWRTQAVEQGWVATAFGRKRWFPSDGDPMAAMREGGNHVIQGTNADITKIAMTKIQRELLPLGGSVLLNVYDEVVAQVPVHYAEQAAEIVRRGMEEPAKLVLKRVPIVTDLVITNSWSEDDVYDQTRQAA